jgi:hypothetical protein
VYGKYKKLSQPAVSSSRPDEVVFASQTGASFASSSNGDGSCDTTTSSEGSSSSSSSDEGHSPTAEAAAAADSSSSSDEGHAPTAEAAAAADPPSEDEVVRPAKREPLSPLSVAPRSPAAKRLAAAQPSPTPPQPPETQPTPPPSPPVAGAWRAPTPLFLPTPPEGLYAAGGEEIARAARREAQLDGALDKQLREDADGPLLARMTAAGAPLDVAAQALSLTRAALTAAGPSAGKAYVAGLKQQIAQLARQLAESNALVTRLRKSNSEWRRAALGEGGAAEGGEEEEGR